MLKIPVTEDDHIQGEMNAKVTLVEYGDYECPYCGLAFVVVSRVQKFFGKDLRFVFRNFPLAEMHPNAMNAATTAEYAASLGKFWEMHDILYENQQALAIPDLIGYAKSLGLSGDGLVHAIEHNTFEKKIKDDFMGGVRSGVNGTPTFFINGYRHNGSFEFDDLIAAIGSASE